MSTEQIWEGDKTQLNEIEQWFWDTYIEPKPEKFRQMPKVRGEKPLPIQHRCAACGWWICEMEVELSKAKGKNGCCIYCLRGEYEKRFRESGMPHNSWR